jgi:hypothetical protein
MNEKSCIISLLNTSYSILLILVAPVLAFSQSGDTVFTVKMKPVIVSIVPVVNELYKNVSKKFTLVKPADVIIDTIIFSEGSILRKDSVFAIKPSKTGTGMLKIYAHAEGGKPKLALVKEFAVGTFAEPKPNIDGVDNDSAVHRMRVVAQGYVNVPATNDPNLKRVSHKVLSFEMQAAKQGTMDTLKATGNRMTYEMRDRIDKMQDGNVIQLSNIKYLLNGDTFIIRQPLRVYLLDDKITKF